MKAVPKLMLSAIWAVAAIVVSASVVQAIPGGPWASSSSPLTVAYSTTRGSSYGEWQGYREDQGRGSRIQDWSAHRRTNTGDASSRGIYVQHDWYSNGQYCYMSSWSDSGGGISCANGWSGYGSTNTATTQSLSWQYKETWKGADPTGNSGRGKMQTCVEIVAWPNTCSDAYFLRGSPYRLQ